jgi:hypothetical protein
MDNSAEILALGADKESVKEESNEQEVPLENPEVIEADVEETDVEESINVESHNDTYVPYESSSIQIAPTGEVDDNFEFDPMSFIQLGDRVVIDSKKYGRTTGTVYYRSLELISVKPDGVSNILHYFEVEQVDGEEIYKEEDGVSAVYIIEKRIYESFVEQQDFRVNQIIDTFDRNGDAANSYKIVAVDKENDVITIQDLADEDTTQDLQFHFTGIEADEDFRMISIRSYVSQEEQLDKSEEEEQEEQEEVQKVEQEEEQEEGIQLVGFVEVTRAKVFREAASHEQRIPDNLQKIDALNDFMSALDPILQKNPKALRSSRILVETLFQLKQATISYRDDGSVQGTKDLSAQRLSELIENTVVPLGRPVLSITKKEYIKNDEDDIDEPVDGSLQIIRFENELDQIIQNKSKLVSTAVSSSKNDSIVREWHDQKNFYNQYLSPWTSNGLSEPVWKALSDSEFFRSLPPVSIEENGTHKLLPTIPGYVASHEVEIPPIMEEVPFGIERALSTTYHKGTDDRRRRVLFPEEKATIESYIMFPLSTANHLGTTRSRNITVDSGRSQLPMKTMKMILESMGAPKEVGSSKDIILLNVQGNTVGNIPLADYIQGLTVPALGLGDTIDTLEQYGMENLELNRDITQVLLNKIEMYQSQLLKTLSTLRQMNQANPPKEPTLNPLIENPTILEEIRSQPTLVESLADYERTNLLLASSDIGQVQHLLKYFPIYFQVAAGKNPVLVGKALMNANLTTYLHHLQVMNTIAYNEKNAGHKPMKNTCRHVPDLVSVRKIFDDGDRFHELSAFFKKYQGKRDNNWINCNICKEHLLCIHEILQLQAYINPKEKDTLEKEIILKCSGGVFQGKYICRNCGQTIRELDFDNNLEFDDNGQPKSGRAVLVDEDALLKEKLDILVSVPIEPSEKSEMNLDENELKCYDIIREIAERAGIPLDDKAYRRIITNASTSINKFPSMEAYNKAVKGSAAKIDYQVALARISIAACALYLLIEIQTKIPSYVPRYTLIGCSSPGFDGYPLDPNPANKQGIEYIACAVASITRKSAPWNQSGFQSIADDVKRQTGIIFYMNSILKESIADDTIQAKLAKKRAYLINVLGTSSTISDSRPKDMIPLTFLPEQMIVSSEEAAKDVIRPDVAANMGPKGKIALIKLWIRQAHGFAKQTTPMIGGSPLMGSTCCLSAITQPGHFWKDNDELPKIGHRLLQPYQQGQFMLTEFHPRLTETDVVSADKDLYYRIFLKCCFQGLRKGYPHEPGLTHRCHWCDFQFPTHPSVMDTNTEGKSALISQEITTNTEEFTDLLDTIHTVNKVEPLAIKQLSSVSSIMEKFGKVEPAPIEGWSEIIKETTQAFLKLPPQADRSDIVLAAGTISKATGESEEIIYSRLKSEKHRRILEDIAKLSWINFFQVIQIYFITPFQRLLSQFSKDSLFIPIELIKSLSETHTQKDLKPILENDVLLLLLKETDIKKPSLQLARAKIAYYVKQMSALLPYKNSIRPTVVPGRHITLEYIQRSLFFGPLSTLLHSGEIPPGAEIRSPIKSMGDPSMRFLLELIAFTLEKYDREHLSFDDKEIKNLIAINDEKERVKVVAEFDKLSDEERGIELMNKSLGIGKWAVGGTKLIHAYDKDYYDQERQKRLDAGIVEFPGKGNGELEVPQGRELDELGFNVYGDNEFEADGGYDHNQHGDDDME